jgi:prophage tail gpP-like protein
MKNITSTAGSILNYMIVAAVVLMWGITAAFIAATWGRANTINNKTMDHKEQDEAVREDLEKMARANGWVRYDYPDGFYCFGEPDQRKQADAKHEEWLSHKQWLENHKY